MLWGWVKTQELANFYPDTIGEAEAEAEVAIRRAADKTEMLKSFLRHCGLSL